MSAGILDAILSRRTIHTYLPEKVPAKIIEEAVLAGIHAPNHKMTLPWRFYWLGPDARERLAKQNSKFSAPGEIIVLAIKKSSDEIQSREDYASLACAVQNMSLYLAEVGYGSKWSTGKLSRTEGLLEAVQKQEMAPQEQIEICGIFWVGKADKNVLNVKTATRPEVSRFLKKID